MSWFKSHRIGITATFGNELVEEAAAWLKNAGDIRRTFKGIM